MGYIVLSKFTEKASSETKAALLDLKKPIFELIPSIKVKMLKKIPQ